MEKNSAGASGERPERVTLPPVAIDVTGVVLVDGVDVLVADDEEGVVFVCSGEGADGTSASPPDVSSWATRKGRTTKKKRPNQVFLG
ncbi:hypothetical protein C5O22_12390 [Treponema sp. J25]|nr:hypothetical protein C5O22_12390 [Treponema sp. J25]